MLDEEDYENEPPLLEELGINPGHILNKSAAVLTPFSARSRDTHLMDDSDLAGPLVFCLILGMVLLLRGKMHFGAIYGVGTVGCGGMYLLLNLMVPQSHAGVDLSRTVSVLGYGLLPLVLLVCLQTLLDTVLLLPVWRSITLGLMFGCVAWSTVAASSLIVAMATMDKQRWLVAYPIALVYACFALLAVF
jgi:hypothetical protein